MSEVRRKAYEARSGVLAERKVQEAAAEHRALKAWNQEENQRLQQLRCESEGLGGLARGQA